MVVQQYMEKEVGRGKKNPDGSRKISNERNWKPDHQVTNLGTMPNSDHKVTNLGTNFVDRCADLFFGHSDRK